MKTFRLDIITPEKTAFSADVSVITMPGGDGQMGILPGHVPIFTNLTEGEVKVVRDNEEFYLAIGGGFLEVTRDRAVILVTSAYDSSEINEQEVLNAKKRAEEALKTGVKESDLIEAQAMFRRATIALKVLHRKRGARQQPVS